MDGSVHVEHLSKIYRQGDIEVRALNDVTLDIPEQSFVSVSGPSGSGKTTLLNMIGGLDVPDGGEVLVAGRRVDRMSKAERAELRLRSVGFVFQAYNLIPVLTALENVSFVMQLQGVPPKERTERSRAMLAEVGLSGMEHRRPSELSGGQQQRVAVARAIVSHPSLVLADEPTANLDSAASTSLLELMQELNREKKATFIFSTHDQLVMSFAERLIRLKDGQVESDERRV